MARAMKGGQLGANGEFYKGGRFLNTVPENPKVDGSRPRPKKPRKVQIALGVWVLAEPGQRPLFSEVGHLAFWVDRYDPGKGIEPVYRCFDTETFGPGVAYNGTTLAEIEEVCRRFNAGEIWF